MNNGLAQLWEVAALNWCARSKSELARPNKRFRRRTMTDMLFWVEFAERHGAKLSFR
jgi:hypothetical protein